MIVLPFSVKGRPGYSAVDHGLRRVGSSGTGSAVVAKLEFEIDDALLARVDAWRSQQPAPVSQPQAISELVAAGLRGQAQPGLSLGEKLILSILCDVSRTVGAEGTIDPGFLDAAVKGGHAWAIEWEHPSLAHGHTNTQATADFVTRVLSMWRLVEDSFARLPEPEKAEVCAGAALAGSPTFPGWHGELEANYKSTARFMTDRMNLFPMFAGRAATEAGGPVVQRYKAMIGRLAEFERAGTVQALSAEQLIDILRAG